MNSQWLESDIGAHEGVDVHEICRAGPPAHVVPVVVPTLADVVAAVTFDKIQPILLLTLTLALPPNTQDNSLNQNPLQQ